MDLTDRHVVVTGGSRGMGAAFGRAFAAAGARVTLLARGEDELAKVAADLGVGHLAADVTAADGLAQRLEGIAPVDVIVNNAGLGTPGELAAFSAADLRRLYEVNALAPAELARQLLPAMQRRASGRLVFISSLSAQVALPGLTAYSATKAAISQLAEGLRRDLRGSGVGVTNVELGPVDTGLYDEATSYPPCRDAFDHMLRIRMLRKLTPEEVASAVVNACQKDRDRVVRPRRAAAQVVASHLPQWVADRML
ncbi:MAG TPA: SDR family oxidoreductase [Mycobacteriales bacterium]|nr:SDR family oxidoreductase [Mycobacteriales bacterium]